MDTEKKKILVVDDSKEMSTVMGDMLAYKGYDTTVVHSGKDAIEHALKHHPDLILLDLRMPDMDGIEVVRTLRKDAWGKTAKILVLTAVEAFDEFPPDLGISTNDYLVKAIWGIEGVETRVRKKLEE